MNTELQAIKDKWDEKTAAKYDGLEALQAAKAVEVGKTADSIKDGATIASFKKIHATRGIDGDEGKFATEFQNMVDTYIKNHENEFTDETKSMTLEQLVNAVSVFRAAGLEESQWRTEVWLRYKFEPQNIGGEVQARVRVPGLGG